MLYAIAREACMFERFISYFRRRSIPAESGLWFDAHCHVFNVEYLALEASRMLFDIIRGTYPLAWKEAPDLIGSAKGSRRGARRADPRDSARKFLAWAMELLDAGTDSEERNGEFITETGMAAFSRAEFGFVPLMMDIYYMQAGAPRTRRRGRTGRRRRRRPRWIPDGEATCRRSERTWPPCRPLLEMSCRGSDPF
jgi:hypothetical protein